MALPGFSLAALAAKLRTLDTLLDRAPAGVDVAQQSVGATVVGRGADGRLVVTVDGRAYAVPYDSDAAPGATVRLPARLLANAALAAIEGNAGNQATTAPAANLSAAARLLATLPPPQEAIVRSQHPLAAEAPSAQEVAHRLRDAVDVSGLFYESHVADWAQGERPLSAIAREPQMGWPRQETIPHQAAGAVALESVPHMDASTSTLASALPTMSSIDLPPAARELVAQQLAIQEAPRVAWSGDVWPGQPAHITISGEEAQAEDGAGARRWRVTLATDLPQLGRIEAVVELAGGSARVELRAAGPDSAQQLAADVESFRNALAAAGVSVAAVTVKESD